MSKCSTVYLLLLVLIVFCESTNEWLIAARSSYMNIESAYLVLLAVLLHVLIVLRESNDT